MMRAFVSPLAACCFVLGIASQSSMAQAGRKSGDSDAGQFYASAKQVPQNYVLGPDDQITVQGVGVEEISSAPVRIDMRGNLNFPMIGRLHAAGLTAEQLEGEILTKLKKFVRDPQITVAVSEFRSQPVSVLGEVERPGVHQLQGRKNLFEILSMAGGLKPSAGYRIKVTRQREWGRIPLPTAADDSTGEFSVAEISVKSIMEAQNPQENIQIQPNDVISVPRAKLVYVTGAVKKSGGFVLGEEENISVLQALTLAEGLDRVASSQNAKILRREKDSAERLEIAVDLKKILGGKATDPPMRAEDILFVPNSAAKSVTMRTLEAAIQMGTGIAIYRR